MAGLGSIVQAIAGRPNNRPELSRMANALNGTWNGTNEQAMLEQHLALADSYSADQVLAITAEAERLTQSAKLISEYSKEQQKVRKALLSIIETRADNFADAVKINEAQLKANVKARDAGNEYQMAVAHLMKELGQSEAKKTGFFTAFEASREKWKA